MIHVKVVDDRSCEQMVRAIDPQEVVARIRLVERRVGASERECTLLFCPCS